MQKRRQAKTPYESSRNTKAMLTPVLMVVGITCLHYYCLANDNQPPKTRSNVTPITVEVDPRVELIGIVFRLAGSPEFNEGEREMLRAQKYGKTI